MRAPLIACSAPFAHWMKAIDLFIRLVAIIPVLEADEAEADVLALADEAEAGDIEHLFHRRVLLQ